MRGELARRLALVGLAMLVGPSAGRAQDPPRELPPDVIDPQARESPLAGLRKFFFGLADAPVSDALLAGRPEGTRLEPLTMPRAYDLALIRLRDPDAPRFDSLGPGPIDERALKAGAGDFGRFRRDFEANPGLIDPAAAILDLQARRIQLDDARRQVDVIGRLSSTLEQLIQGEAAGVSQLDLDRARVGAWEAQATLDRRQAEYRDRLDRLAAALRVEPGAPMAVDLAPMAGFVESFRAIDRWLADPRRDPAELDRIGDRLPAPGAVRLGDRRPIDEVKADPGRLEEVLSVAARAALDRADRKRGDLVLIDREKLSDVKLRARRLVRDLIEARDGATRGRREVVLAVRQFDHLFEQVIAPPSPAAGPPIQAVRELIDQAGKVFDARDKLVADWANFQAGRIALEREVGHLSAGDWAGFFDGLAARPGGPPR